VGGADGAKVVDSLKILLREMGISAPSPPGRIRVGARRHATESELESIKESSGGKGLE